MDDKDLQQELEKERFKGVYKTIDANYELVNEKIDTNHKETTIILKQILEQTKKTNGRVTCLEEETRFTRTVTKYPKLSALAFVGLIVVGVATGIVGIIKIF